MAHLESHYDNSRIRRTDEYGNPIVQPGEYGDLAYPSGDPYRTTASTGWQGGAPATGQGIVGEHRKDHHTLGGMLRRSGSSSSSSSSSEDDGHGGRRKKGLKEKIKEKLPGQHQRDDDPYSHTSGGYYGTGEHHEKKGVVEKIKEKLPGSQNY